MAKTNQIGEFKETGRGFGLRTFSDRNGAECSIQCSSAIDFDVRGGYENPGSSMLWVGVDDANPKIMAADAAELGVYTTETHGWISYPIPPEVSMTTRMHLTRKQVRELIKSLNNWLRTGSLEDAE